MLCASWWCAQKLDVSSNWDPSNWCLNFQCGAWISQSFDILKKICAFLDAVFPRTGFFHQMCLNKWNEFGLIFINFFLFHFYSATCFCPFLPQLQQALRQNPGNAQLDICLEKKKTRKRVINWIKFLYSPLAPIPNTISSQPKQLTKQPTGYAVFVVHSISIFHSVCGENGNMTLRWCNSSDINWTELMAIGCFEKITLIIFTTTHCHFS